VAENLRETRERVGHMQQRVADIENRLTEAGLSDLAAARDFHTGLEEGLREVQAATRRADAASTGLERREQRLRDVATAVASITSSLSLMTWS